MQKQVVVIRSEHYNDTVFKCRKVANVYLNMEIELAFLSLECMGFIEVWLFSPFA